MTRTRFAPSPDGFMHFGNLKNALISYLICKKENGEFILRIEDTNQKEYNVRAEDAIYKLLDMFNFKINEGPNSGGEYGPYVQSERLNIYQKYADELVKNDCAYYCFCSEEKLEKDRMYATSNHTGYMYDGTCRELTKDEIEDKIKKGQKYCIRLKVDKNGTTSFKDELHGNITVRNETLDDQIILKSDGFPTYLLSNVVDDGLMNITHVVRGDEYLSSTPKSVILYNMLNFDLPKFIHLPHIKKDNGVYFSKKNRDDSLIAYLNSGYLPEAIINYLGLLGWSSKDNREFYTLSELVNEFTIEKLNKDEINFNIDKLNWYNSHYIKLMNDEEYNKYAIKVLNRYCDFGNYTLEYISQVCLLFKSSIEKASDISKYINIFIKDDISYDNECRKYLTSKNIKNIVNDFVKSIQDIEWTENNIKTVLDNINEKYDEDDVYMILRIATTGYTTGADLVKTIYLIELEKIMHRLG